MSENQENFANPENYSQEDIYKLSAYEQQMNNLQKQIESIKEASKEIAELGEEIEEIKGKKGQEIFAHIGRGIYAKAQLLSEDFIVDVGGRKFVKKDISETKELIQKQIKKLDDAEKEVSQNLEQIQNEMMNIISKSFRGSENYQGS